MEKKIGKNVVALGLSMTMLSGQIASSLTSVMAQEPGNIEDYSDTTRMRSVDTLDADALTVDRKFNVAPLYDVENNELLLPRIKGYKVEVFGSDNKATISLDGKVTRPLVTQTVKLLYKITNEADGTFITTEENAIVKIPAKETEVTGQNSKPQVIPELREWVASDGQVDLTNARIVLGTSKFKNAAETFKADYKDLTGRDISIVNSDGSDLKKGDIFIGEATGEIMLGNEGYYMNVGGENADQDYIEIKATHNTGALYGTISILQILKQDTTGRNNIAKGLIKDYPEFEQRGMMLDVARKWIPMEYLQDLSKQMSWYKLNMLSLHLSDNDIWNGLSTANGRDGAPEGWFRLESELYPELTKNSDGSDRGEYYTKEQFRNFQYSSMDLGIDVIPELDTPGHALAYTRAWPGSSRGDNQKYLDAKNPENLEKIKALFSEYILGYEGGKPTFVGPNVNIGTDEYKSGTATDKEAFRAYCDALLKHVKSLGKEPVFWGSLLENNGTTEVMSDATMFAWYKGYADAKASLEAGYKIISMEDNEVYIVPGGGYYSNQFGQAEHLYNNWLPNKNSGWNGRNAPDAHPGVSGGQFAVWNDFAGNGISVNDISYRIQHNLYTIAQKTWAGTQAKEEGKSYADVKKLAATLGDAPNADFLYEIDKEVENNELVVLDDKTVNKITNGATITGSVNVSEDIKGKNDNGLAFNGKSSYLSTDLKSAGFGWTTSMWINPSADGILMEGETGTLRLEAGKIKYDVENYTHTFDCNIKNGDWTHIALTGTFEGVSLYINGEKFDSLIGKAFPNWNNSAGCNSWSGTYPINEKGEKTQRYYETLMLPMETIGSKTNAVTASVDELNIYNKVLTDNEIAVLAGTEVAPQFENLALNAKVTASGNESATKNGYENVVDGDMESRWASNYDDAAWLIVDLGKGQNVNNIKIFWEAAYGKKYKILVSETGEDNSWQEVYNEENGSAAPKDIKFDMKENIRYVKFQGVERPVVSGGKWGYSFYEMEVYGDKVAGEYERANVALNKEVEVGNYHAASTEADRSGGKAVDGDLDSRWEFDKNKTEANFIKIPLAADEDVDKVIVKQMVWGGANRISKYRITAVNGDKETEIISETSFAGGEIDAGNKIATQTIELGKTVKADAIKIYLTPKTAGKDDLVNIREIELYGSKAAEETPDVPVDPVIERNHTKISQSTMSASATSEHPYYVGVEGLASMAIDGNSGTWWHTNWSNKVELPQSITLDLGDVKTIGKYTYLPRSGAGNGTISKYILETSVDGKNFTEVAKGNWEVNVAEKVVEFAPTHARYVRLTALQGVGGYASAAELNVYKTDAKVKADLQQLVDESKVINLDNYIETTKADYLKAISNAEELLKGEPTEKEIADASKAIQAGLEALDVAGDKTALKELYDANKELSVENYVKASYDQFKVVLDETKAIVEGDTAYGQKALDQQMAKLEDAINDLISTTELKNWIIVAEAIDMTDVTKDSGDELKLRITNAKEVLANDKATANQVEIAVYRLGVAYDELEADATALETLINSYQEKSYTASSWQEFLPALTEAQELLNNNPTITELTDARTALASAASVLTLRATADSIDKLKDLIAKAEGLDSKDYTESSWQGYMELINQAKELLKDEANLIQAPVDKTINSIETYQLVMVEKDNKAELKEAIDKFEANQDKYTTSSWNAFKDVLANAKKALESTDNNEVVAMIETLNNEAQKLQLRGNVSDLAAALGQYAVPDGVYTKESYDNFIKQLEIANKAINDNSDLTQEQIDQIKADLAAAFEGLVKLETPDVKPVVKPDGTVTPDVKPTGDDSSLEAFLLASGAALGAMLITRKKRKEDC